MTDEIRHRRTWLDGFMAYPAPKGVSDVQRCGRTAALERPGDSQWNSGEQLVFGWCCAPPGLRLPVGPHPLPTEFANRNETGGDAEVARRTALLNSRLAGQDALPADRFEQLVVELGPTPLALDLPFDPATDPPPFWAWN